MFVFSLFSDMVDSIKLQLEQESCGGKYAVLVKESLDATVALCSDGQFSISFYLKCVLTRDIKIFEYQE